MDELSDVEQSLWRLAGARIKARALRSLARQLQPYLEPGTVVSNVSIENHGTAPAIKIVPGDGIVLGSGSTLRGRG